MDANEHCSRPRAHPSFALLHSNPHHTSGMFCIYYIIYARSISICTYIIYIYTYMQIPTIFLLLSKCRRDEVAPSPQPLTPPPQSATPISQLGTPTSRRPTSLLSPGEEGKQGSRVRSRSHSPPTQRVVAMDLDLSARLDRVCLVWVRVCVCVCVCVCLCVCVCMYVCVCMCVCHSFASRVFVLIYFSPPPTLVPL